MPPRDNNCQLGLAFNSKLNSYNYETSAIDYFLHNDHRRTRSDHSKPNECYDRWKTVPKPSLAKITYGSSVSLTGNTVGPDKSLRIGVGNWASPGAYTPGKYLIVAPDQEIPKEQRDRLLPENFIGIAVLRYIEETKAPRMRYHKGNSGNNNEILMFIS